MSLKIKASVLLGVIVSFALGISGYYYLNFLEASLRESILKGLVSVNDTTSRSIVTFLADSLKEAEAVANAFPQTALEQKDARRIDAVLKSYSKTFGKFGNGMFVLDEKGVLWADYPEHPAVRGRSFAFRQYFQKTMAEKKGIVGMPYRSARTGKPVATFTAPLKDTSGRIIGMLGCSVQLTSPDALEGVRLTRIGRSGYIYVFNRERLLILHPQESRILQQDIPVGANSIFDAAIGGFEGTGETINTRGIPMLISINRLPGTGWIVAAQQPKAEAMAPIKAARKSIILGIFSVAAISVLIGSFLMKGITQPLIQLQHAIRKIGTVAEKDNSLLIEKDAIKAIDAIKADGEIESLKNAFKIMSEKLDSTMRSLYRLADDWENTFNSVPDIIFLLDSRNRVVRLNQAARMLLGKPYGEISGHPIFEFLAIPPDSLSSAGCSATKEDGSFNIKFNENQTFEIFCNSLRSAEDSLIDKALVGRDITFRIEAAREKMRLEEKLQKAHKMEAIGTLAGGVAHDLNNILSGVVSYPELLLMQLPKDSPLAKPLETIMQSGRKATAIVQDLLTLARRGAEVFETVNLNTIVNEYLDSPENKKLRTYHPNVEPVIDLSDDLLNVKGSSVHLSKSVMNLVSNAVEAMPDGGKMRISTQNRYVDKRIIAQEDIIEGDYVVLAVSDEGLGIEPGDLDRIFEPFYTKKKMGHSGTGLGMSVVWGTVKDHQGFIDIQSSPGAGTTISVYLPATHDRIHASDDALDVRQLHGNGESILVVDDVEAQREIASAILMELNYTVYTANSGEEALIFLENEPVDLLILDMIMDPGIDGLETYRKAIELMPGQKAIIASGYSETKAVKQALAIGAGPYIKKPYTIEKMGSAVKEALEA